MDEKTLLIRVIKFCSHLMFKEILTPCTSKTQTRFLPGLPQSSFPLKPGTTQAQSW